MDGGCTELSCVLKPELEKMGTLKTNGDPMGTQNLKKVPMGTRVPKWGPMWEQCKIHWWGIMNKSTCCGVFLDSQLIDSSFKLLLSSSSLPRFSTSCFFSRGILILMKVGISTSTWFQVVPFCSLISEQFLFSLSDDFLRCL